MTREGAELKAAVSPHLQPVPHLVSLVTAVSSGSHENGEFN